MCMFFTCSGVRTPGVKFVKRRVSEEYHPDSVMPTVRHGDGIIMIWGCMTADGVGVMFVYEGRMNSQKYINVLETILISLLIFAKPT